jgi:hypothetical protein
VLGEIPYGGPEDRSALSKAIPDHERIGVLKDCWAMLRSGLAAAALPPESDMERRNATAPLDVRAFVRGICSYRDQTPGMKTETLSWAEFRAEQRVTPLDVTTYVARAVDRLLVESHAVEHSTGGYPTNNAAMKARLHEIEALVSSVAQRRGIDLSTFGPVTEAHRAAMLELRD